MRTAGVRIAIQWNEAVGRENCRITFNVDYTIFPGLRPGQVARYATLIKRVADVAAKLEMLASALIDSAPYDPEQVRAAEQKWGAQRQREGLTPGARKVLDRILEVASKKVALSTDTRVVLTLTGAEKRSLPRLEGSGFLLIHDHRTTGETIVKLFTPGLHLAHAIAEENTDA